MNFLKDVIKGAVVIVAVTLIVEHLEKQRNK